MEVLSLEEGIYSVDSEKNLTLLSDPYFRPKAPFLRMAVRPFVIRLKNELVMLDCGLGLHNNNGNFIITLLLKQYSLSPNQITKVLLSHLHKDHIEGLGYFLDGSFIAQFQNATIYASKQELDYSLSKKGNRHSMMT